MTIDTLTFRSELAEVNKAYLEKFQTPPYQGAELKFLDGGRWQCSVFQDIYSTDGWIRCTHSDPIAAIRAVKERINALPYPHNIRLEQFRQSLETLRFRYRDVDFPEQIKKDFNTLTTNLDEILTRG